MVATKNDGRILLWDLNDLTSDPLVLPFTLGIRDVGFSPDGHLLVAITRDGTLLIWDLETEMVVTDPLQAATGNNPNAVSFGVDGSILASGTNGLVVWPDLLNTDGACVLAERYVRASQLEPFLNDGGQRRGCDLG